MKSKFILTILLAAAAAAGLVYLRHNLPQEPVFQHTAAPEASGGAWAKVWSAIQDEPIPAAAREDGPPVRVGERVLFRFRAPADATKVYLAGSFNGFAHNASGHVTNNRFAMRRAPGGFWFKWVDFRNGEQAYKLVVEKSDGSQTWLCDPNVQATGKDGNTAIDFSALRNVSAASEEAVSLSAARPLKTVSPSRGTDDTASLDVRAEKVWVQPGESNSLVVTSKARGDAPDGLLDLQIATPFGEVVHGSSQAMKSGDNRLPVPALDREGGYVARVTLFRSGQVAGRGEAVLSVVRNVADDLRYGFYASYGEATGDYTAKAAMLARLHINAVEFYDYFPAHGHYAPQEKQYRFEPFGIQINSLDVQGKIAGDHQHGVLSLAYIAAYAASESVYRKYPYPMTDKKGVPKIFNGEIMSEERADREHKPKWFWLMNVADDSPWHAYMMGELRRTLDDDPGDLVSFDGFEIDTYGDSPDTKFFARDSRRNGDLLSDVLHDFVDDVQKLTHEVKPYGLVSFNSVNEFGVGRMYDVTDFLFLEIWRFYTDQLGELVDICFQNRAPRRQRVILKLYPADMNPAQKSWPCAALRRVLGAAMTGGGSLMVVGEPDEKSGQMHGLNTLYYPDHQPLRDGNEALLRAYYRHDAMLLGYTHGPDVFNTDLEVSVPGCFTRVFAAPKNRSLIVQFLRFGDDSRWSADAAPLAPQGNQGLSLPLPGCIAPKAVFYASPDAPALRNPVPLDFDVTDGILRTMLPELQIHGTLVLRYE